ncbi:MAG: hypothetical protein BGO98_36695 [Myxococcales bacterium 68-20]|nr:MAG: hypothetical protein BGO98_36695 [Myxococcales bacterium 68-20]
MAGAGTLGLAARGKESVVLEVRERIVELIWEAVDALNEIQSPEARLEKDLEAKLFGKGGRIDSLGLVQLISEIETKLEDHFGVVVALADERAMSQTRSPFRTFATLADYASSLVMEAKKGG